MSDDQTSKDKSERLLELAIWLCENVSDIIQKLYEDEQIDTCDEDDGDE